MALTKIDTFFEQKGKKTEGKKKGIMKKEQTIMKKICKNGSFIQQKDRGQIMKKENLKYMKGTRGRNGKAM